MFEHIKLTVMNSNNNSSSSNVGGGKGESAAIINSKKAGLTLKCSISTLVGGQVACVCVCVVNHCYLYIISTSMQVVQELTS